MSRVLERHIEIAKKGAATSGEFRHIVEVDEGEGRKVFVCNELYIESAEFEAFDGKVLATVEPNGEVRFERE